MSTFIEQYGEDVVEIVEYDRDFDGHGGSGTTTVNDVAYGFSSNYNRRLVPKLLEAFKEAGFPKHSVGFSEDASGHDEESGRSFPVPECIGVFFDHSKITGDMMVIYRRCIDKIYKEIYG